MWLSNWAWLVWPESTSRLVWPESTNIPCYCTHCAPKSNWLLRSIQSGLWPMELCWEKFSHLQLAGDIFTASANYCTKIYWTLLVSERKTYQRPVRTKVSAGSVSMYSGGKTWLHWGFLLQKWSEASVSVCFSGLENSFNQIRKRLKKSSKAHLPVQGRGWMIKLWW